MCTPVSRALGPAGAPRSGLRGPFLAHCVRCEPAPAPVLAGAPAEGRPALSLLGSFGHGAPGRSARALRSFTCGAPTTNVRVPAAEPLRSVGRLAAKRPRSTSAVGALPPLRSGRVGPPAPASVAPAAAAAQGSTSLAGSIQSPSAMPSEMPSHIPCWRRSGPAPPSTASRATGIPRTMPHQGAEGGARQRGGPDRRGLRSIQWREVQQVQGASGRPSANSGAAPESVDLALTEDEARVR